MKYLIFLFFVLTSCSKGAKSSVAINKTDKILNKIPYSLTYNYRDSLVQKIVPDKNYSYWVYARLRNAENYIIREDGDSLQRPRLKMDPFSGFFSGCHPNSCTDHIIIIDDNNDVKYISTADDFEKFLGEIDNLEEAILLAELNGFNLDIHIKGSAYRQTEDGFILHLAKDDRAKMERESFEITVSKGGNISSKSLGVYCKGMCLYNYDYSDN